MQMTRIESREMFRKIDGVLKSDEEVSLDVVYALTKTKNKLKAVVEETNELIVATQKAERQLTLKHCKKDDDGKPVIVGDHYAGLEPGICPEYDTAIAELEEKRSKFFNEAVEIEVHLIDKASIPAKGKANMMELLCMMIKE